MPFSLLHLTNSGIASVCSKKTHGQTQVQGLKEEAHSLVSHAGLGWRVMRASILLSSMRVSPARK